MNITRKVILLISSCLLILIFFAFPAHAGWFFADVPKGMEVKDQYLEQLFAPDFPYEWVKVVDTKEGKRYVVVKAKSKVSEETKQDYRYKTLHNRGMVIHREGSIRTDELLIAEMRFYRTVTKMPYIVEYCEVKGSRLRPDEMISPVEDIIRRDGKYLIVLINKDFGKVFKQVEIYPEKDVPCPEPSFVGKYPKSRCIGSYEYNNRVAFIYASKDKAEDIYNYYRDKLKIHYKRMNFNLPEERWEFTGKLNGLGMNIRFTEVANLRFEYHAKDKQLKSSPAEGLVAHIEIQKIGLKPIIDEYSIVRINYVVDPGAIKKLLDRMK